MTGIRILILLLVVGFVDVTLASQFFERNGLTVRQTVA